MNIDAFLLGTFGSGTLAWYALCTVLGLVVGSFLNVVALRLPRMLEQEWRQQCVEYLAEAAADGDPAAPAVTADGAGGPRLSLSTPPSTCPHCGHRIRAVENIPVLSYLWLRGRCSACGAAIGLRYPLVEIAAGAGALLAALVFGTGGVTLLAMLLFWVLLVLAVIDFDTRLLPDCIVLPVLWLGLLVNCAEVFATPADAILGAVLGYGVLRLVFEAFRLLTGKEGMGFGDFKLLAMLGAWLGFAALPLIIVLSSLVGAVIGSALMASGLHERGQPIPFGPFIAAAGALSLFAGDSITAAYLRYSGLA